MQVNTESKCVGTLLVVDDNESYLQMLAWRFEDIGYRVITARDCREAIAATDGIHFDVGLIDYYLPDNDGCWLVQKLNEKHSEACFIIMSADLPAVLTRKQPEKPFLTMFDKPLDTTLVADLIGACMSHRQSGQNGVI